MTNLIIPKMNESYKPDPLIGYKFISRSDRKSGRVRTVVDKHITKSELTGDIVKTRYVTVHELMGQPVYDYDVPKTTIMLGSPA